ncbi:MAG TPA: hypothetical protein PLE45_04355 [Spirochaetota bacterium]|nr:hypothetical protein [Spirochaetota bacterium]HOL56469.1 hypothetical protein [Spirochaetota bacterium]HPP03392.1 hypothetical protein [Spirochaetota bacterium]
MNIIDITDKVVFDNLVITQPRLYILFVSPNFIISLSLSLLFLIYLI